jgi:hypothetical protein
MFNMNKGRGGDTSELNVAATVRWVIITTLVFLLIALVIYAWGASPPAPSFQQSDLYETETWDEIRVQQREELQEYDVSSGEVTITTRGEEGAVTTETMNVTRFTMPIDEAESVLVEQGLPTINANGTVEMTFGGSGTGSSATDGEGSTETTDDASEPAAEPTASP